MKGKKNICLPMINKKYNITKILQKHDEIITILLTFLKKYNILSNELKYKKMEE